MRYVCSLIPGLSLATPAAFSQDGAALYRKGARPAMTRPRAESPRCGAIRQMTGEAIYGVLTNGVMKPQAEGLSTAELIKLIVYIAPTGGASTRTAFEKTCPATSPATQAICSPAQSAAATTIPGAVFSGAVDGHMRAYSTGDGRVIRDFDTAREFPTVNVKPAHGGSIDATGAAVVGGKVFVTSGYNQWGGMPGNVTIRKLDRAARPGTRVPHHGAPIGAPMWEPVLGTGQDRAAHRDSVVRDIPLRRFGTVEEVAALAAMLASDEVKYMTGSERTLDGGLLAGSVARPRPLRACPACHDQPADGPGWPPIISSLQLEFNKRRP